MHNFVVPKINPLIKSLRTSDQKSYKILDIIRDNYRDNSLAYYILLISLYLYEYMHDF